MEINTSKDSHLRIRLDTSSHRVRGAVLAPKLGGLSAYARANPIFNLTDAQVQSVVQLEAPQSLPYVGVMREQVALLAETSAEGQEGALPTDSHYAPVRLDTPDLRVTGWLAVPQSTRLSAYLGHSDTPQFVHLANAQVESLRVREPVVTLHQALLNRQQLVLVVAL